MAIRDGRQWGVAIDEIARNHVARYTFAADWIKDRLPGREVTALDAGCGCGYGTYLLARAGAKAVGVDRHQDSITFARETWAQERASFCAQPVSPELGMFDLAVAFEVIEHVDDPPAFLRTLGLLAPVVIASVPNEEVQPFSETGHPDHKRHYTPNQFTALFDACGFHVREYWSQASKETYRVVPGSDGGTMIYVARRFDHGA